MIGLKRGLFLPCVTPSKVFKLMLMTKKRKLNSKNPKYYPVEEDLVKERKELIAVIPKGKKREVKVYAVFSEI